MSPWKAIALILGALAALLGGLWLVQGLGLVTIEPIACVANCETLQGPSPTWAILGAALAAAGLFVVSRTLRRRRA
jgi:hypothetical protein